MLVQSYSFTLFADYHQFYLQDEQADGNPSDCWTEQAVENLLALATGTIGVCTVRNMDVPVAVEIHDAIPEEDLSVWDHVMECGIELESGRIVIAGCTDYFPEAERIDVQPGKYRARIYYGALDSLSEDGLDGDDHYKIALWRSENAAVKIIKKRNSQTYK